jgi:hypothetical protein
VRNALRSEVFVTRAFKMPASSNVRRLAAGVAILTSLSIVPAHAEETTWETTGTFSLVRDAGSYLPPEFVAGTPYRLVIRFDNSLPPSETRLAYCDAAGCRLPSAGQTPTGYRYIVPQPDMRIDLYAGASCQPCTFRSPTGGSLSVRDNYPVALGPLQKPTDGISLGLQDPNQDVDIGVIFRTENLGLGFVTGMQVPYLAPTAATVLETNILQFQNIRNSSAVPEQFYVTAGTATIDNSTYGLGYIFTARDCRVPARTDTITDANGQQVPVDSRPYDCSNVGANRRNVWSMPGALQSGGALGLDGLSSTYTPSTSDIDTSWGDGGTNHAQLGLVPVSMGTLFGEAAFNGPAAFPVIKGSTFPGDNSRINTNLFSYQKYSYSGGVTQLPLVLALTYTIDDNSFEPDVSPFVGDRPGGASLGATMSIVDGSAAVRLEAIRRATNISIRGIACGNEAAVGLPTGSVLGTALIDSAVGEAGSYAVTKPIESCASPGQPVQLQAGQDFIVVTGMQLPSRGKAPQPPRTIPATENGWVDSANTLRVTFDPAAPRALVQELAANIEPACTNCSLEPEELGVGVDIKPGSTDNCLNPASNGVVPVGILGSPEFSVTDLRIDETLMLGSLGLRVRGKAPGCTVSSVNGDEYPDLVCHFSNQSSAWQPGQSKATLTGQLYTGVPVSGSDDVCLTQ